MAAGVTDQLSEIGEIVATLSHVDGLAVRVEDLEPERYRCDFKGKRFTMPHKRDEKEPPAESTTKKLYKSEDESILDLRSSDDLKRTDDLRSKKLDRYQAKRLAQEILRDGTVSYTAHCESELKNDSMDTVDAANVLRCGKIEREPELHKSGSWRYHVETQRMLVVIEIHSKTRLRVVTAWRKKKP
jgi:hypothetical protein